MMIGQFQSCNKPGSVLMQAPKCPGLRCNNQDIQQHSNLSLSLSRASHTRGMAFHKKLIIAD
jgi:hypothetical protein